MPTGSDGSPRTPYFYPRSERLMKSKEESHLIGFRDGQQCGDKMVQMYDLNELLEKLRNPKLEYDDIYYKDFLKSGKMLTDEGIDYESYRQGFYAGCRDIITVGNEEKELGTGD